jgi:hypothetical protein
LFFATIAKLLSHFSAGQKPKAKRRKETGTLSERNQKG